MENLVINGTKSLPAVFFNKNNGILIFTGKSLPEDPVEFYGNIENSLNEFILENPKCTLSITCEFEYLNTSSSKYLFDLLKKAFTSLDNVLVIWGYEDEDEEMLEQGQLYEKALNVEFLFKVLA